MLTHLRKSHLCKLAILAGLLLAAVAFILVPAVAFAQAPAQPSAQAPAQTPAQPSAQAPTQAPAQAPAQTPAQPLADETNNSTLNAHVLTIGPEERATANNNSTPLAPGIYTIQSALAGTHVLDVAAGSTTNTDNVQIYSSNKSEAQRWRISIDDNGYYTIQNVKSGLCLDLSGAKVRNGQNIWQYASNNTPAQKWVIGRSSNGYTIASSKDTNYMVDVSGGRAANSTNVQLYKANGTPAQRWWFIPENPAITPQKTIDDGVYEIRLAKNERFGLDLAGQSIDNGANIWLYSANNTVAQRWAIKREVDGYYTVKNVSSGKPLEVAAGGVAACTNIAQYTDNGTAAQRWAIQPNGEGSYTFINKKSGLALDIAGGNAANGTNVHLYIVNNTAAQKFTLKPADVLPEDVYALYTMLSPARQVVDTPGGSQKPGTQDQLYTANGTMAQKFVFRRTAANTYAIQNVYSGMYLEDESGKVVQRSRASAAQAQAWIASFERNGVALTNKTTGKRFAVAGASSANGTKTVTAAASNVNAQHWRLRGVSLLVDGCYTITNTSGKVLDVAGGSLAAGTNVQIYEPNNTAAQKFFVHSQGNGYYTIVNDRTDQAVEVKNGSAANGANVQQNARTNTARQQWKPRLREDGAIEFTNKASGKVLDVAGGSKTNGANVQSYGSNGTAAQGWLLKATTPVGISGNKELDDYIRSVALSNNMNLRSCYDWVVRIPGVNAMDDGYYEGTVSNTVATKYALYVKHRGVADCYGRAALFMYLARACGYSANFHGGNVWSAAYGREPHGWTEVYLGGKTYVCDASLVRIHPERNWYLVTYEDAPTEYLR